MRWRPLPLSLCAWCLAGLQVAQLPPHGCPAPAQPWGLDMPRFPSNLCLSFWGQVFHGCLTGRCLWQRSRGQAARQLLSAPVVNNVVGKTGPVLVSVVAPSSLRLLSSASCAQQDGGGSHGTLFTAAFPESARPGAGSAGHTDSPSG